MDVFRNVTPFIDWLIGYYGVKPRIWTTATNGHIVHSPDDMNFESDGVMIYWQGKNWTTRRKTCPSATLSTTNPTWIDPGANHGLRCERPATNHLSRSTAPRCTFSLIDTDVSQALAASIVWFNIAKDTHVQLCFLTCSYILISGTRTVKLFNIIIVVIILMLCFDTIAILLIEIGLFVSCCGSSLFLWFYTIVHTTFTGILNKFSLIIP
jgi:hypothetical protein